MNQTVEYSIIRIIDLILEGVFIGFGLSIFCFYLLTRIDKNRLKPFYDKFIYYSLRIVRITGLVYSVYFIYLSISNFSRLIDFFNGEDTEVFYSLFFLCRSLLIILLTQLLWYKKVRIHRIKRTMIAIVLFVLGLFANNIIERFIIFSSYYNTPIEWRANDEININEILAWVISSFLIERIILFSAIVFICWMIFKNPKLD